MNREKQIEESFIRKLTEQLKYVYRDDIHDRASLEANFRQKFETLNKVKLSDSEFDRLLEEVINPDVFVSSKRLRERNTFTREDGTPLQYTLVNIKDWCKNDYEIINQLRMNTDNSYHRYDVILLINGIPVVQIELKTYDVSPRRAMQQIVLKSEYKNVTIPINIILYIESVDNYVKAHLADDSSVFSKIPLRGMEEQLPPGEFVRIHRSFVVARNRIARFTHSEVTLSKTGKILPVGKKYAEEVMAMLGGNG